MAYRTKLMARTAKRMALVTFLMASGLIGMALQAGGHSAGGEGGEAGRGSAC
jgi:hypothetical protein